MNLQDKAPWYSFKSLDRFNHRVGRYHKALVKHCELDIRISLDMGKFYQPVEQAVGELSKGYLQI
jgi:hypothetical protein